ASWVEEKRGTGLQLAYSEHENSPAGLHVEKTLRLTAPETIEATYRISLGAAAPSASANDFGPKQSFISMISVPAFASEEVTTHFCWDSASSSGSNTSATATAKSGSGAHCQDFIPSSEPVTIPAEITRLEIQSAGRRTLTVEWTSAQPKIVPSNFSPRVTFAIP